MKITHLGHACVLVEAAGARILIDPGAFSDLWHGVRNLDAVLITHQHADHVDPDDAPGLLEKNPQAKVFTADDVDQTVLLPGAEPVIPGQTMSVEGVRIEAVGGNHAIIHQDIPRIHNIGYLLRAEGEPTFFHPGDALDAAPEGVEVLALPLMGPWAAMKEHVEFVRALNAPKCSIPIHDELLSDRGRELLSRQISNLTGTEIISLRGGACRDF
ncbi:MBL fold metallo-hydrolase [Nesterenkonia ebinurensis]|uniref:MBL fold metallo-hydrolase n=1 Tax=Nesterenkonia ebinurensis TaxID=2608252 RepID=UPI00123E0C93|nr:MBL fold metallo-hydrolase [Nesterenkonia ebinurensis]